MAVAWAWLHIHAAPERTWKQGVQVLRVDWPVYPRRAEHNTVAEGGNRRWAETARQNAFQSRWPRADQRTLKGTGNTTWIDRPVDTQDVHSLLPRPPSGSMDVQPCPSQ